MAINELAFKDCFSCTIKPWKCTSLWGFSGCFVIHILVFTFKGGASGKKTLHINSTRLSFREWQSIKWINSTLKVVFLLLRAHLLSFTSPFQSALALLIISAPIFRHSSLAKRRKITRPKLTFLSSNIWFHFGRKLDLPPVTMPIKKPFPHVNVPLFAAPAGLTSVLNTQPYQVLAMCCMQKETYGYLGIDFYDMLKDSIIYSLKLSCSQQFSNEHQIMRQRFRRSKTLKSFQVFILFSYTRAQNEVCGM